MVRLALTTLAMCAVAEDSLMQFEKASDFDVSRAQGHSRTARMQQTTQAMVDQWKSFVVNVAKSGSWKDPQTGNPWIPDKEVMLEPVQQVIVDMEGELDSQKDLNTWIMGNHTQDIANCISNRNNALTAIGSHEKQTMINSRNSHSSCRALEVTEMTDMEAECLLFENIEKCDHEQDWFAAYDEGNEDANSLHDVVQKAVTCKTAVHDLTQKANECDADQKQFTKDWCDYHDEVETVCNTFNTCHANRIADWDLANETIVDLEREQKVIFRMLGRIRCYLDLLFAKANEDGTGSNGEVPTLQSIEECENVEKIEDSSLDVEYGQKAEPDELCQDHSSISDERTGYAWPSTSPQVVAYGPHQSGSVAGKTWYTKEITDLDGSSHGQMTDDAVMTCDAARQ